MIRFWALAIPLLVCFSAAEAPAQDSLQPMAAQGSLAGDPEKGRLLFGRCRNCHDLTEKSDKAGPGLAGLFGRKAGTNPNYSQYSRALRESGIIWSEQAISTWLADPNAFLPGNKMAVAPVPSAQARADLIAYLRDATR